jgi:hypothetical protein
MSARQPASGTRILLILLGLAASFGAVSAQGRGAAPDARTVVHVLNRLGFGPAPGDVERVQRMGLQAYVDEQLNPSRLPDEQLAVRLAGFETLTLSTRELAERYYLPAVQQRRQAQRARRQDPDMRPGAPAGTPVRDPAANPAMSPERRAMQELPQQKILRAAYSTRQLE